MLGRQKAVAVGCRGGCGSCVAVVFLGFFFCGLLMINWQKEAETQQRPRSQVLNCRTATSCARLGKVRATLSLNRRCSFMQKKRSCDLPNAIGGLICTISLSFFFLSLQSAGRRTAENGSRTQTLGARCSLGILNISISNVIANYLRLGSRKYSRELQWGGGGGGGRTTKSQAFQPRKLTDEIIINQDGIKWN